MLVYPQSLLFNLLIIKLQSSLFVSAVFSVNIAPFNCLLHYLSCLVQFLCMPLNFLSCFNFLKKQRERAPQPLQINLLVFSDGDIVTNPEKGQNKSISEGQTIH